MSASAAPIMIWRNQKGYRTQGSRKVNVASKYRVDDETKYRRRLYLAEGQTGKTVGLRLHSGGQHGVRLEEFEGLRNLSTDRHLRWIHSDMPWRMRKVSIIPLAWLIGFHHGRFRMEGDMQKTSWNDPTASANDTSKNPSLPTVRVVFITVARKQLKDQTKKYYDNTHPIHKPS